MVNDVNDVKLYPVMFNDAQLRSMIPDDSCVLHPCVIPLRLYDFARLSRPVCLTAH